MGESKKTDQQTKKLKLCTCHVCGKEFFGHTLKSCLCSPECRRVANRQYGKQQKAPKLKVKKCLYCGKEYTNIRRRKYCSD